MLGNLFLAMDYGLSEIGAGAFAAAIGFLIIGGLLGIALYVYSALAFSTIGKKLKYKRHWIAWIPIINFFLLPILAKYKWYWGFIFLVPFVNVIFVIFWLWKIFEYRKYPGWLALTPLLSIIPVVGFLASIAFLVIIGFVAWKDR